jgi:O-antigen/teichoic acid export membrane protein
LCWFLFKGKKLNLVKKKLQNKQSTKINFSGSTFKKYFSNTSWLAAERVFRHLTNFLVSVYVIRYLGAENNGVLAYAVSVYVILASVAGLGLGKLLQRELINNITMKDELLGSSTFLNLGFAIIITSAVFIFYFINPSLNLLVVSIVAISVVFHPAGSIENYFISRVESKYPVYSKLIGVFCSNVAKVMLIITQANLIFFAAAFSLEIVITAFGNIYFYRLKKNRIRDWRFKYDVALRLLKNSWPLMFSSIAAVLFLKIDVIIMENLVGVKYVGVYDVAVKLSEGWYFVPMIITSSLFPAIVASKKVSEILFLSRLQKLYDLLTWLAILIAVPIFFMSHEIISFLFGPEFMGAAPVLSLYVWAGIPVFLLLGSNQYLIAENFTMFYLGRAVIGMIVNIILNYILIPHYYMMGAAWATVISYSLTTFSIGLFPKTRKHFLMMLKSMAFINLPGSLISFYRSGLSNWISKLKK